MFSQKPQAFLWFYQGNKWIQNGFFYRGMLFCDKPSTGGVSLSVCFISIKWPFKNLSPGIILLRYELYSVKSRIQSLAAILIAQIKSYEHLADSAVTIKSTNKKFQCWKLPSLIIISLWFCSIKCLFYRQHFYEQYQDEIRKISSNY